jgi:hypothetical protein
MNILFVDIDGVLNSAGSYHYYKKTRKENKGQGEELCPIALSNVDFVLSKVPDCKIVISSTWRKYFSIDEIKGFFKDHGYEWDVIDATPEILLKFSDDCFARRKDEIEQWLDKNSNLGIQRYVAIDDHYIGLNSDNFVQTNYLNGFTFDDAQKVCAKLGYADEGVYLF